MSLIKPLNFSIRQGDADTDARTLQQLETVHRSALMAVLRGKNLDVQGHFYDPLGVATYYGFGADGTYYEAGVAQRTWLEQECIDDFADMVTDTTMWAAASGNTDLGEGGINYATHTPFGRRLYVEYAGPGAEVYDRKGLMVLTALGSFTRVKQPWSAGSSYQKFQPAAPHRTACLMPIHPMIAASATSMAMANMISC